MRSGFATCQESQRVLMELNKESTEKTSNDKGGNVAKPKKAKSKWIRPLPENHRRTQAGRRLVVQEVSKLLTDQSHFFPQRAMLDGAGKVVRYSANGQNFEIKLSDVEAKARYFFSYFFADTRRKLDYGTKVHSWLTKAAQL